MVEILGNRMYLNLEIEQPEVLSIRKFNFIFRFTKLKFKNDQNSIFGMVLVLYEKANFSNFIININALPVFSRWDKFSKFFT